MRSRFNTLRHPWNENSLDQTTETEVLLDDDIWTGKSAKSAPNDNRPIAEGIPLSKRKRTVDGGHDEADLGGVGGAGEVGVDLLLLGLVQRDEAVEDVIASGSVVGATLIVGEVVLHGADGQLLLEAVDLVEEENDRGLNEPARVANRVEQGKGFLHAVDSLILEQQLVVLGDGDQEENGGDVLEAVNPLLTLGSLATDVEHAVGQIANDEGGLGDTGSLDTRAENILVSGEVVGLSNAVNSVEVAGGAAC